MNKSIVFLHVLIVLAIVDDSQCLFGRRARARAKELERERTRNAIQADLMQALVKRVQKAVVQYIDKHPGQIHSFDKFRIKNNEFVERYVSAYNHDEKVVENAIISSLRYINAQNFHGLNDTYFPAEFYATGVLQMVGRGHDQQPVLNVLTRCFTPMTSIGNEITQLMRKFTLYQFFKLSLEQGSGYAIINEQMRDLSTDNVDTDLGTLIVQDLNTHFRSTRMSFVAFDLGTDAEFQIKQLFGMLQSPLKESVTYALSNEISQWLNVETIPARYGGTSRTIPRLPEGVKSAKCSPHLSSIPATQWEEFRKQSNLCIKEGMAEVGIASIDEYISNNC